MVSWPAFLARNLSSLDAFCSRLRPSNSAIFSRRFAMRPVTVSRALSGSMPRLARAVRTRSRLSRTMVGSSMCPSCALLYRSRASPSVTILGMASVRKVVFPAAGLGTRFLPATKGAPEGNAARSSIGRSFNTASRKQWPRVQHVILVTSRGKNCIEDHFDTSFELETQLSSRVRPKRSPPSAASRARHVLLGSPGRATWSRARRVAGSRVGRR